MTARASDGRGSDPGDAEFRYQEGLHEDSSGRPDVQPLGAEDATIGDDPTENGHGAEELDDVTDDGSRGDGTLGDGETADAYDAIADERLGTEPAPTSGTAPSDSEPELGEETLSGEESVPGELRGDAMGRPLEGSMDDDDQGMENAGESLGD